MSKLRDTGMRQGGYSLVEVLVAFAILALALTLLLRILSGSARQVHEADDAGRAALHALSLIEQIGVGVALEPGRRGGELEDGRFHWTLDVDRYEDPLLPPAATSLDPGMPVLMQLSLTVEWAKGPGRSGRVALRTLRLVRPTRDAAYAGTR